MVFAGTAGQCQICHLPCPQDRSSRVRIARRYCGSQGQNGDDSVRVSHDPRFPARGEENDPLICLMGERISTQDNLVYSAVVLKN